jgi:hypothetical protein
LRRTNPFCADSLSQGDHCETFCQWNAKVSGPHLRARRKFFRNLPFFVKAANIWSRREMKVGDSCEGEVRNAVSARCSACAEFWR